jgi:hypothetical protein
MVSLWGSKNGSKNPDEENQGHEGEAHPQSHVVVREADERTRLIPPPPGHGAYLDPDDPAVRYAVLRDDKHELTIQSTQPILGQSTAIP